MDQPQNRYKTIHVTGTNGKGSTTNMLAGILTQAKIKTGMYTSPHLVSYTERMQIDGQQIPMSVAVSASGARYESIDDQRSYSWHTKSNQGVVGWKSIDKQGVEILLFSECSTAE